MNSNRNPTTGGSRLREPATVVRRATLATCRSRTDVSKPPTMSVRASNISNKTASTVGSIKRAKAATKPPPSTRSSQQSLKRPLSSAENCAPAAKVSRTETKQAAPKKSSKRAAWDYKGRLEDMEVYVKTLCSSQEKTSERLEHLESQNSQLKGHVVTKEKKIEEESALSKDLRVRLDSLLQSNADMEKTYQDQLERERVEKELVERENNELKFSLEITQNESKSLKLKISQITTETLTLTTELKSTKDAFVKTSDENQRQAELITTLKKTIEEHLAAISNYEQKLREEETARRVLHNTIQELKGNIRVFCRVRPNLESEKDFALTNIVFEDENNMMLCQNGSESVCGGKRSPTKFPFTFDKIFSPNSTQELVFDEISQLVQSVLDGYNVCIFAYGQTGSGKTYTMEGNLETEESWGMIPRALQQVFLTCENLRNKGWQYEMEASFLEIYNEAIRDLLGSGNLTTKHEIKLVPANNGKQANDVIVTNLRTVSVTSSSQVSNLLRKAYENRAVAATNCNERSSRSHSVFRLKMTGVNSITEERCEGTLNLVDLAGSERLSQSGSTGARLKETQNINKSLSNLGIVITALANKEQHIPYRNSKLTYLLQNSLGGNSKSLMFVNISAREDNFQETISSLRFATKVNTCNIGTAQKAKKL